MKTVQGTSLFEEIIKKSRFIAIAARADTPESALHFLETVRHPDASHNCWAYKISESYRFSDDGEPGGTAGRPMFMAIEKQAFDHVMIVVIRYFGGIKLGAGGLSRAYGGAAGKCLQLATPYHVRHRAIVLLTVPFEGTGIVYPFLDRYPGVDRLDEEYTDTGLVMTLRLVESDLTAFKAAVMDVSRGGFGFDVVKIVWE